MKVTDLFRIDEKTVFVGDVEADERVISNAPCAIEIDGTKVGRVLIAGEVHTGKPHRDLWTKSRVDLNRETIMTQDVWLISCNHAEDADRKQENSF